MVRPIIACLLAVGCSSTAVPVDAKHGYVTATSSHVVQHGATIDDASAEASFPGRLTAPTCVSSVRAGSCVFTSGCANAAAPGATSEGAGVISIEGALVAIVLRPDSSPTPYLFDQPAAAAWHGGETLTFKASGGSISAFSGTVEAPAIPIIDSPALDENDPQSGLPSNTLTIDRSRDLDFAWTSPSATKLSVAFSSAATATMSPSATLSCEFDATMNKGTVPASLLAMMPVGQGVAAVGALSSEVVSAGEWTISLTAQAGATAPNGASFGVPALFR